jgi:hypothetical protein
MKIIQRYLNISCESTYCVPPSRVYRRLYVFTRVYRRLNAFYSVDRRHVYTAVSMCLHVYPEAPSLCVVLQCGRHHVYTAVCVCLHECTAAFMLSFTYIYTRLQNVGNELV